MSVTIFSGRPCVAKTHINFCSRSLRHHMPTPRIIVHKKCIRLECIFGQLKGGGGGGGGDWAWACLIALTSAYVG